MTYIEPPDNPTHDPDDPRCTCDDCEEIAAWEHAERIADGWRDER